MRGEDPAPRHRLSLPLTPRIQLDSTGFFVLRIAHRWTPSEPASAWCRVKVCATEGPAQDVFFAQQHPPDRLGALDFTHMGELGVTIQGRSFPHLIYHFVLTYSNQEAAMICFSESFESLTEGLQNALDAG